VGRPADRWRVDGAFSAIKMVFGVHVTEKKFVNTVREMVMKASIYNGFIKAMVWDRGEDVQPWPYRSWIRAKYTAPKAPMSCGCCFLCLRPR
jgi:hypothetical protein